MKYIISLGLFIGSFLTSNIIITMFSYFEFLNPTLIKILKIFVLISSCLISGIFIGLKANKKGYFEGLKIGVIITIIFIIIALILKPIEFNKLTGIYYLIILSIEVLGSIIGINKKKFIK